jgi:hypothetical protein
MGGSEYTNREVEGQISEVAPGECVEVKQEPNPKDKDRVSITEKDGMQEEWYKEAKAVKTKEDFIVFFDKLDLKYMHDYGTICHAVAATALAGAYLMEHSDQGGITGFQAGAINWEFISHWMHIDGPARFLDYSNMLYPQYQEKFEKVISQEIVDWLKVEAMKLLAEAAKETSPEISGELRKHWEMLAAGNLPWGFVIKEEK